MERIEDVVIAGGGPAGAYCAFELAKKGISATVLDNSHPREKPCGGGISPSAIEKFPFVEQFSSKGNSYTDFKIILSENKQVVVTGLRKRFNISRRYFDEAILNRAIQNGAKLIKERIIDVQNKKTFWQIRTNKRLLATRILVGADGVNSLVRRKTVGSIPKENLGLGYGYLVTGVEKEYTTMKFLDEIPGYIWIFPRNDHSSIGIGSNLKYGNRLKKLLDDFICSYCPHIKIISRFAAMFPFAEDPDFFMLPCAGEDWILVGDAAGHADPISGEGILYALWSAKLAAEVIKRNKVKSYDKLWREEYGNNLRERCKKKDAFYDPLMIALSIINCSQNKIYSWITT
ncbi:MAG: NAD(P)/FAD-dependent oxidoreductase [Candidatus Bathyarchaeota archaeon]|jgi:geranylgeranyl reductase family protein